MTDLSLGWQLLGAGVLGATIFLAILFVVAEWKWICFTAITAGWWLVTIWTQLFTDELAKDDQHVPVHRDADEILIAVRTAEVFDLAAERHRRLLAASLIEECGHLTGPAFSFEHKEQ